MTSYRERSIALLLGAGLVVVSQWSFALSLQSLQNKLHTKKRPWQAGETSVSDLSEAEIKKMLGAKIETDNSVIFSAPSKGFPFPFPLPWDDEDEDKDDEDKPTTGSLPDKLDWRNHNGVDYASPILDQGRCGSCVAFAVVGALETQMNISRSTPFSPWSFSPQHLFSCGGGACERGWTPTSALGYVQNTGIPDEACYPYESGIAGKDLSCSNTCSDASSRSEKIAGYTTESFFFKSVPKLKKALTKGPLVATMVVYEDFIYYKGGVYEHTDGKQLGGHAVTIQGYDEKEKAFIVRNSWGPDWGEKGYFRIKYDDDSQIGNNAYGIQVGKGDGFVAVKGLRENSIFSGKVALDLLSTYPDTNRISYELVQGKVQVAQGSVATNSSTDLDTTTIPDGTYLLKTLASTKNGSQTGHSRKVNVLNGTLTGKIEFTNMKDGSTVTGEKKIELSVTTKPIVPTELTFFFKYLKTGEVTQRTTLNVGPSMNLNWRTDPRPKGDYEVWLVARADKQTIKSDVLKVTLQ